MTIDPTAIKRAVQTLAGREPAVAAVYLHGSVATGRMDKDSDVDIAILAGKHLSKDERRKLRLRGIYELAKNIGATAEDLDVVILQDVPILLQYNVIRKGRCLYEREKGIGTDFELSVERRYDDEEPYLRREAEMILHRILRPSS